jgi:hypothetical protein
MNKTRAMIARMMRIVQSMALLYPLLTTDITVGGVYFGGDH